MEEGSKDKTLLWKKKLQAALAYIVVGAVATLIVAGLKSLYERSSWSAETDFWTFQLLQGSLSTSDPQNPVIVIDVSDVDSDSHVLLPKLSEIIKTLKTLDRRPVAIGVDVDFSPPSGVLSSDAVDFFDTCLRQTEDDVPVYLGVGDNKSGRPDQWLGLETYRSLASAVAINRKDTRWIPIWVRASGQAESLNTLNYALALAKRRRLPGPPSWLSSAIDKTEEPQMDTRERTETESDGIILKYGERLVNFSKLETTLARKDTDAESVKRDATLYSGKLVIIGDAEAAKTPGADLFPVPGFKENQPGSLLLASSTYTLIKEPLFFFKPNVRTILDLLIAGFIIIGVAITRYRNPSGLYWLGKQAFLIYMSVAVVIASGFLLVSLAGVMWLDFPWVVFALFLHPKMERLFHLILARLKTDSRQGSNGHTSRAAASILIIIFIGLTSARAQHPADLCQSGVVAVAQRLTVTSSRKRVKRSCYLRQNKNDTWHELSQSDIMKTRFRLYQDLRCDGGCSMEIYVCATGSPLKVEYFETKNAQGKKVPGWFTFGNPFQIPRQIIDPNPWAPSKKIRWPSIGALNPSTNNRASNQDSYGVGVRARRLGGIIGAIAGGPPSASLPTSSPTPSGERSRSGRRSAPSGRNAGGDRDLANTELVIKFERLIAKGNAERDAKNYSAAEQAYSEAGKLIPTDSRAPQGLGNAYYDQEKWEEAANAYDQAIVLGADSPDVYVASASLLIDPRRGTVSADRSSRAESYLWTAARMQPQNERIYDLLNTLFEIRGDSISELEANYRRALTINPESFGTNLRLSMLLRRSGRETEANRNLTTATKSATTAPAMVELAKVFESLKRYDKAKESARKALALNPNDASALIIMGLILIDTEHYSSATSWLQHASQITPNDFVSSYLLAIARLRSNDPDEAERSFDQAASKISTSAEESLAAGYWLAVLGDEYSARNRKADAIRAYKKALTYDPDNPETSKKLAKTLAMVP